LIAIKWQRDFRIGNIAIEPDGDRPPER